MPGPELSAKLAEWCCIYSFDDSKMYLAVIKYNICVYSGSTDTVLVWMVGNKAKNLEAIVDHTYWPVTFVSD